MPHPIFGKNYSNKSLDLRLSEERALTLFNLTFQLLNETRFSKHLDKPENLILVEIHDELHRLITQQSLLKNKTINDYEDEISKARDRIVNPLAQDSHLEGEMLNFDAEIKFLTAAEGGRGYHEGKDASLISGAWSHVSLSCGINGCKVHSLEGCREFNPGKTYLVNMDFYCVKHDHAPEITEGHHFFIQEASHVTGSGIVTKVNR